MKQKSKFSKCDKCPLFDQPIVPGETNCEDDLSKVRLLILAEAPATEEIKNNRPLIGKAGKVFRTVFEKNNLNKIPNFITNVVLCSNVHDGKTYNPPEDAFKLCSDNWKKLIEITNPELIVVMGTTAKDVFDIKGGITKIHGNVFDYNGHNVLVTYHPSFIARKGGLSSQEGKDYEKDMTSIHGILDGEEEVKEIEEEGIYSIKLEGDNKKFYDDEYELLDVQRLRQSNKVLYIFQDKDHKKYYLEFPDDKSYRYEYKDAKLRDAPFLISCNEVKTVITKGENSYNKIDAFYESDVSTEIKHAIDFYYNKGDRIVESFGVKTMFADIELYNKGERAFPDIYKAEKPINAISFKIQGDEKVSVYITNLDEMDKSEPVIPDWANVSFFDKEEEMLKAFGKEIKERDPFILCGWNFVGFDAVYLMNRMKKLRVPTKELSPYGESYSDNKYGQVFIYGLHILDQMELYKEFTYSVEESYKLDAICKKVLGEGKLAYEGTLDELYVNNISKFIEYSAIDTIRLEEIEEAKGHIKLKFELIKRCSSNWKMAEFTTGLIDPLVISYAKRKGIVCRDSLNQKTLGESFRGAYVRAPLPGLHEWIIDFDFSSLYPSIICTFNIGPNTYIGRIEEDTAFKYLYDKDNLPKEIKMLNDPWKENNSIVNFTLDEFNEFVKENEAIICINGTIFKGHNKEISFFNEILTHLLKSRKEYNRQLNEAKEAGDKEKAKILHNVQLTYKIIANSIYGVIGHAKARMFDFHMAESVTMTGQEATQFSGHHIGKYLSENDKAIENNFMENYDDRDIPYVLYQDTDSIFITLGDYLKDQNRL